MLRLIKLSLLLFPVFLSSCFTIQPLEFKNAENISTKKSDTDYEVTLDLNMHNPNSVGLRLTNVETTITIDDHPLGKASFSQVVKLRRKSDFKIPVNAKASLVDLINLSSIGLNLFFGNQTSIATMKGSMTLRKFIFHKTIQFEYKEKIDSKALQSLF